VDDGIDLCHIPMNICHTNAIRYTRKHLDDEKHCTSSFCSEKVRIVLLQLRVSRNSSTTIWTFGRLSARPAANNLI
jgi:hypothetical protein